MARIFSHYQISISILFLLTSIPPASGQPSGIPGVINEEEGEFSGTWTWNGSGYNATWTNGAVAVLQVESFTAHSVEIDRTDTSESVSAGLTAVYTGEISSEGNSIVNGSVTWTWPGVAGYPFTGTWTASWEAVPTAFQFIPITPCRVADTRNATGPFGGPEMSAGSTRAFNIPQSTCGIPSSAIAYSLNVTVVPNASLNYLTVWSTGQTRPNVSTLNSDGRVKANAAIVPAGNNGGVSVYVSDATQVILDIDGYFLPSGASSVLAFYPLKPCRIADTRNTSGPLGGPSLTGGSSRAFPILSSDCDVPTTAKAYSLNVTAVPHKTLGYLTTWQTGAARPNVSTLNSSTGAITANAAVVSAGTSGEVSVFVTDDSDVILDINGYFAPPGSGGLSLHTVTSCRVIDTRPNAFDGVKTFNIQSSSCAPPSTAQGYVLNVTVVPSGPLNYVTLWPDEQTQPDVSTLNADDGSITSNMAIVPTTDGKVDVYASDSTNLILDIFGYFAP